MAELRSFQFADGDLDLIVWCYELRFATIDHFIALSKRHRPALVRRIVKLLERGYLARIVLTGQKHIYTVGRAALPLLVERGIALPEKLDVRLRASELKELFLKHALMIVDIHTSLLLATRNTHVNLIRWREGQELYDSIKVNEAGKQRRLPVRPDGLFTLQDSNRPDDRNRLHFTLEADRSTTTQTRFKDKIVAYWNYLQSGRQEQKYGTKNFRVVTVTLTDERAANLAQMAVDVTPPQLRKFFLFTSLKQFSLENPVPILGDIFITSRDPQGERTRLVPQ
jgi:hypothetical protein